MKKLNLFLSTFVLLSLVLAACSSSSQNGTQTPGVLGTQSATQSPGILPNTGGTQSPTAQATTSLGTQMPTTQATTPAATQMPTTQATTPPATGAGSQVNPGRLSDQLQFQVLDESNQPIGQVMDMVLDLKNLKVAYVIVSLSQNSGSSGNEVAVPWSMLTLQTNKSTSGQSSSSNQSTGTPAASSANSQDAFVFNGDQQKLAGAPAFSQDMLPQLGQPAGNWDSSIMSYWNGNQAGGSSTSTGTPSPMVTSTVTATQTTTSTQQAGMMSLQGVILATKLVGLQVEGSSSQSGSSSQQGSSSQPSSTAGQIGTVQDAVVDLNTGDLSYIILSSDSIQSLSGELVPVPPQEFGLDAQNQALVLQVSSQNLQNAPAFEQGQFPMTTSSGWDAQIQSYWQNQMQSPTQQPTSQP